MAGSGPAAVDPYSRRLVVRLGLVNVAVAGITLIMGTITGGTNLPGGGPMPLHHTIEGAGTALGLALVGFVVLGRRVARRLAECRLVAQDAEPDPAVAARVLRLPADAARLCAAWWFGVACAIALLSTLWPHPLGDSIAFFLIYSLVGVGASAVTYLFAERELRPVFAHALRAGGRDVAGVRVHTRLIVGWVVVAAIPLLQIAVVALMPGSIERRTLLLLAAQGLLAGPLLAVLAGEALESRLERLRDGVARVRGGDLSVRLPVDDPGELGLLQTGFNDMVAGLEERDRAVTLFGRHVGVGVARRALAAAEAEAEQRQASMLFVDVVNSTGITERRSPAEVVEMLNALFEELELAVAEENGFINRFMGDGALCLFGVPDADAQHATRALRAGRRIACSAAELAQRYPELAVAVGVSSGSVVAGNVGARDRYEYTVIGSAVNQAARLVAAAKEQPVRVLAGESTVQLAEPEERAQWRPAGTVQLRGLSSPTLAYAPAAPAAGALSTASSTLGSSA